ncbi:MAG TPA: hypothetical protein VF062_24735 [Candidatus Limnocylindrales bacterium]
MPLAASAEGVARGVAHAPADGADVFVALARNRHIDTDVALRLARGSLRASPTPTA